VSLAGPEAPLDGSDALPDSSDASLDVPDAPLDGSDASPADSLASPGISGRL
jgi:hypothetical protein